MSRSDRTDRTEDPNKLDPKVLIENMRIGLNHLEEDLAKNKGEHLAIVERLVFANNAIGDTLTCVQTGEMPPLLDPASGAPMHSGADHPPCPPFDIGMAKTGKTIENEACHVRCEIDAKTEGHRNAVMGFLLFAVSRFGSLNTDERQIAHLRDLIDQGKHEQANEEAKRTAI